jgi:subtilisin family serine protease
MLPNTCAPDADYTVGPGEMVTAFDYLSTRSNIINISYTIDTGRNTAFTDSMKAMLPYGNRLLVLPAGNDTPSDLDLNPICPACLGNDNMATALRTLVVGAATRELKRAPFSNFGEHTVRVFAPGEPVGALNLKGEPVSDADASTSYAAPLAALAVALMESLGITDADDVRDRLAAATWPLDDKDSRPERTNVGVLDLVKAVAVQHDAVEVLENDADGRSVRRTYVGRLLDPLSKVALCAGQPFQSSAVQAVRLGEATVNGERAVRLYWRNWKVQGKRRIDTRQCRPSGNVRIDALKFGERTFPLSTVTEIQLRWNQ